MFLIVTGAAYCMVALTVVLAISRAARNSDVALARDEAVLTNRLAVAPATKPTYLSA